MTKRAVLHTLSNSDASLSLHSSHRLIHHQRPSPTLQPELQHHPLFTSVTTANQLTGFFHLVYSYIPSPLKYNFLHKLSYTKPSKNNKADWLDFFVGIFCNFNPSAIFTMKHRALAHNCYHTATGG
jgi:hypothetical protein